MKYHVSHETRRGGALTLPTQNNETATAGKDRNKLPNGKWPGCPCCVMRCAAGHRGERAGRAGTERLDQINGGNAVAMAGDAPAYL